MGKAATKRFETPDETSGAGTRKDRHRPSRRLNSRARDLRTGLALGHRHQAARWHRLLPSPSTSAIASRAACTSSPMREASSTSAPGTPTRSFQATRHGSSATQPTQPSSSRAQTAAMFATRPDGHASEISSDPMRTGSSSIDSRRARLSDLWQGQSLGFAFCGYCRGSLATASDQTQERKLVTILFADLAGSTELGSRLDPERLRSLLERYFAAMAEVIESWGGTVEKYIGDAILAAFGVPTIHEDDAERAIRAAIEMLERLTDLNDDLADRYGETLQVRIGVNTGDVMAAVGGQLEQQIVAGRRRERRRPP
mgnify:CR=1 FL=1